MDTRRKILTPSKALEAALALRASGTSITLITGYFDVLQPSLIRQMAATGARVFALVLDPPDPLLTTQARAELAAALQVIDYVIYSSTAPSELAAAGFVATLAPDRHIRAEKHHLAAREQLIRHVVERHTMSAAGRQSH